VKLALGLNKRDTGRTLYILDEPTTGLRCCRPAAQVLHQLRDPPATCIVSDRNAC
jgi:excinuclease UvrABC ATPase subunit